MWSLVHGQTAVLPLEIWALLFFSFFFEEKNLGTADGQKMIHKIVYKIMGSVGFVFI
jgi:hypothetical protein